MGNPPEIIASKLIIHLNAEADASYHQDYHRKLRGVLLNALPDAHIPDDDAGVPVSYTGLLPWGDIDAGDQRRVIVSSFDNEIIGQLAAKLQGDRDMTIGEWQFTVSGVVDATADVGPPGTRGTLESDTGCFVTLDQEAAAEYGITPGGDADYYWREGDPQQALTDRVMETLTTQWDKQNPPSGTSGPHDIDGPLFDQVTLDDTYSVPLHVAADYTQTVVLNKLTLGYEVRSESHREALNYALSTGIGEKNSYGLGTLSLVSKQEPFVTGGAPT